MRLQKLVLLLITFLSFGSKGFAQTFRGTLDGYWSYNSNRPNLGNRGKSRLQATRGGFSHGYRDWRFGLTYAFSKAVN